jgi:putative Holliday junction resolvase
VSVREFAQRLADHLAPLPVVLVDERLTTTSAHQALHAAGRPGRRHRTVVDRTAAAILLQTVLDAGAGSAGPGVPGDRALGEPVPPRDAQADRSDA